MSGDDAARLDVGHVLGTFGGVRNERGRCDAGGNVGDYRNG